MNRLSDWSKLTDEQIVEQNIDRVYNETDMDEVVLEDGTHLRLFEGRPHGRKHWAIQFPDGTMVHAWVGYPNSGDPYNASVVDGPAIVFPDGMEMYFYQGRLHREDGEPAIVDEGRGLRAYYTHGKPDREGGPAFVVESLGIEEWYSEDALHREDGPANITSKGEGYWREGRPEDRSGE